MTREEAELAESNTTAIVYVICVIFIYLILCGMYESLFLPLAVLCSVPFGLMGSYFFTKLCGMESNIYTQVGMVMLIGLLSKTAILITEYGSQRRKRGMSLSAAALSGGSVRSRSATQAYPYDSAYHGDRSAASDYCFGCRCQRLPLPRYRYCRRYGGRNHRPYVHHAHVLRHLSVCGGEGNG